MSRAETLIKSEPERTAKRIQIIDAARGLSIILVVAYHVGYDLVSAELMSADVLYSPLLLVLQPFFAGLFILLSGVSARFSRDNRKRGLQALGCALLISIVAGIMGAPIQFGILHCLGLCMVLCGRPEDWLDRIPRPVQPILFLVLFVAGFALFPIESKIFTDIPYLYIFGLIGQTFLSYDYFPLIPWFFLYLLGAWLGFFIVGRRFPRWFYRLRVPVLPFIGRHTLLIYMLHQPVIYGVVMLIVYMRKGL
jgi:uncharacterized membrane protein